MLEAYKGNPIYFNILHRRNFIKPDKLNIKYIIVIITEYEKVIKFLKVSCSYSCSSLVPKEVFAEMREAFQALSKSEQDIFLMA